MNIIDKQVFFGKQRIACYRNSISIDIARTLLSV